MTNKKKITLLFMALLLVAVTCAATFELTAKEKLSHAQRVLGVISVVGMIRIGYLAMQYYWGQVTLRKIIMECIVIIAILCVLSEIFINLFQGRG